MDSSVVSHPGVVELLKDVAEQGSIPVQLEVLPRGGTDTAAIQRAGRGVPAGCISVQTRYVHSVTEVCYKSDIDASIRLLAAFIATAHTRSFDLP